MRQRQDSSDDVHNGLFLNTSIYRVLGQYLTFLKAHLFNLILYLVGIREFL